MASGWAYFRKHWIKPEVYPLIGAMSAAVGVCGYAMFNKARDPTLGWNKAKRKHDLYQDVEEVVPIWTSAKKNSTSIFSSSREIAETNRIKAVPMDPITVKIGDAEEEEEETSTDEESSPVEEQAPAPTSNTDVDVRDEAAETINAAIDAAIESSKTSLTSDPSEQTASSIAENPPPVQNVQPTSAES